MNIILLCYAISPTKGSEFAFGWDYVNALSKYHNVHLVYGVSGFKIGQTDDLINLFKKSPIANIRLYPVRANQKVLFFDSLNQFGLSWFWYIAFRHWHRDAKDVVQGILKEYSIDLVHTLNPIGFREPGYLWKFEKPHIWGPIGGANFVNFNLLMNHSRYDAFKFRLRNFITTLQLLYSRRVHQSAKKSKALIFSTSANLLSFQKYIGCEGLVIGETGFSLTRYKKSNVTYNGNEKLKMVWAGSISSRKNIRFLLEVISKCKFKERIELYLIGDGEKNEISKLKEFSLKSGISENIFWVGMKTRNETIDLFPDFHLHAITSLSEGNPQVLLETLSVCLPTIALDQDGMRDTLSGGLGFLIPITDYYSTVNLFSQKIDEIIKNPNMLEITKNKIHDNRHRFSWDYKIIKFLKIYEESI
jgi:glycosyltransferase involved in cell wall biosynthesis